MRGVQKIIKYLAVAFAMLLTFNIISGVVAGISALSSIFINKDNYEETDEIKTLTIDGEPKLLNIDISSSNMVIKIEDTFKVETTNKYIECKQKNNIIYITEKDHNWFNNSNTSQLVIYIPSNITLDNVNINTIAGKVDIEKLSTKILNLDLGAGKVSINNLTVLSNTEIDSGAGEVIINNSNLNNLDLSIGVGKFTLNAKLSGNSEIDHGIGEATLNLIGTETDYQIHLDKGLGSAVINGNDIKDDQTVGNGMNKIDIDGGIGNINIDFKE